MLKNPRVDSRIAQLLRLFQTSDVVLLGESHGVAGTFDFLRQALPVLHANGIHRLALEFSAAERQVEADALVTGPVYEVAVSRRMLREYNAGWPYLDYQDLHRQAWLLNQKQSALPAFKIVHASYIFDWTGWTGVRDRESMDAVMHRGHYNQFRADRICEQVQAGQKVLGLFGAAHACRGPLPFEVPEWFDPTQTLVNILDQRLPGRVASIGLGGVLPGNWDAEFETPPHVPCEIDYAFLDGVDFAEIQRNWPDPDWTPVPQDATDYWRIIEARKLAD